MALDEVGLTEASSTTAARPLSLQAVDDDAALILIKHVSDHPEVTIAGDLDVRTASRLRETIELAIDGAPASLSIDGRAIGRIGIAGLNVLADAVALCRDNGVKLELLLSRTARAVLDSVGLWWLGVIDQVPSLDQAIRDARIAYGQRLDLH